MRSLIPKSAACACLLLAPSLARGGYFETAATILGAVADVTTLWGDTSFTVNYALNSYRRTYYGHLSNINYHTKLFINRNPITNNYTYEKWVLQGDGTFEINHDPFEISELRKGVYNCYNEPTQTHKELENFTLAAWISSISQSGPFPPNPPFSGFMLFTGYETKINCADPAPYTGLRKGGSPFTLNVAMTTIIYPPGTSLKYNWPPLPCMQAEADCMLLVW